MHVLHEGVEMHPLLRADLHAFEKHVHEHGLAASDLARKKDASFPRLLLPGKETPEPASRPLSRLEHLGEPIEAANGLPLRWIIDEFA